MPSSIQVRRKHPEREDARYYELRLAGKTIESIALLRGVSTRTVRKGIMAAKERIKAAAAESQAAAPVEKPRPKQPPWVRDMVPIFPILGLTKDSTCPHHGPIPRGSDLVCMVCHRSGKDDLSYFRPSADDPRPDPKPWSKSKPKSKSQSKAKAAGRQRRQSAA